MLISTISRCGRSNEFNCSASSPNGESVSLKIYFLNSLIFNDPLQRAKHFLFLHYYSCIYKKKKKNCFINYFIQTQKFTEKAIYEYSNQTDLLKKQRDDDNQRCTVTKGIKTNLNGLFFISILPFLFVKFLLKII